MNGYLWRFSFAVIMVYLALFVASEHDLERVSPLFAFAEDTSEATLELTNVDVDIYSIPGYEKITYSLKAQFQYSGQFELQFMINNMVLSVDNTPSEYCSVYVDQSGKNVVFDVTHIDETTSNEKVDNCHFKLTIPFMTFATIRTLTGNLVFITDDAPPVNLLTYDFLSVGSIKINQIEVNAKTEMTRVSMFLPLNLLDEKLQIKLNLQTLAKYAKGNVISDSKTINLSSVHVVCPHEFDAFSSTVSQDPSNPNDFIFSLSNKFFKSNNLFKNRQIYCEFVLPLQLGETNLPPVGSPEIPFFLSYSIYYNSATMFVETLKIYNKPFITHSLISVDSTPSYKVKKEGESTTGTGLTEVEMYFRFSGTLHAKHFLSVVVSNSFKAKEFSNCNITFNPNDPDSVPVIVASSDFGKVGNSHFYVNLDRTISFVSSVIEAKLTCWFVNSLKYTSSLSSPVYLTHSDYIPLLKTLSTQHYQLLSEEMVGVYGFNTAGNIYFIVEPNSYGVVESMVASLTWTDKEKTVAQQFQRLRDLCLAAAVSLNDKFTSNLLFPIDLTVNGRNSVAKSSGKNSIQQDASLLALLSTSFISDNQTPSNQYAASFGFTSGYFSPEDIQKAIDLEIKNNPSLDDVSTSVVIDQIIEQCINQGYGCGELCAPCTGDNPCRVDEDCMTGLCSFGKCSPYDTYFDDNSAFSVSLRPFSYLLVLTGLIIFVQM